MTSILVTADLHLEIWSRFGRDPFAGCMNVLTALDALIIAGDLADRPAETWPHYLDRLSRIIDPGKIWIVPGNHDYYGWRLDDDDGLRRIVEQAGVNFAQKQTIMIGGDRYLCCTLWTDFQVAGDLEGSMQSVQDRLMDYERIMIGHDREPIHPLEVISVHQDHLVWLETELAKTFLGKTFVITHHAPHACAVGQIDNLSAGFASDLERLIRRYQPVAWLFGHTHERVDARVQRTLIRNISFGYPSEVQSGMEADILMRGLINGTEREH